MLEKGQMTDKMREFIESNDNLMLIDKGVNQKMSKKGKIEFIQQMRELYEDRIEGLQDYAKYDMDIPRMEVHGNLPTKLMDTITEEVSGNKQRVLKQGLNADKIIEAINGLQEEGNGLFTQFQKEFLERFDKDNLIGLSFNEDGTIDETKKLRGPTGLDDKGKRNQKQLRDAYKALKGIRREESGLGTAFRALRKSAKKRSV